MSGTIASYGSSRIGVIGSHSSLARLHAIALERALLVLPMASPTETPLASLLPTQEELQSIINNQLTAAIYGRLQVLDYAERPIDKAALAAKLERSKRKSDRLMAMQLRKQLAK